MINKDQYSEPIASDDQWDIPDTCKECGGNCSKTERRICLSEIEGVSP